MPTQLERDSHQALYEQLTARLRELIKNCSEGERLPTEKELVQQYGLSRSTVRRGLDTLIDEGLLIRRQGKGTFVAPARVVHPIDHIGAFLDTFSLHGLNPESELLAFEWLSDPERMPAGVEVEQALYFERIHRLDGEPYDLAKACIPEPFGGRVSRSDLEAHTSFDLLARKLGLAIARVRTTIRGVRADAATAKRLGLSQGDPVMMLIRWFYTDSGELAQQDVHQMSADRFEFSLDRHAQSTEEAQGVITLKPVQRRD
jgi:GntR family transcriptional regulator